MHSGLSMVESMVTPKDVRRMIANASGEHTQNQPKIKVTPLDIARMQRMIRPREDAREEQDFADISTFSNDYEATLKSAKIVESVVTAQTFVSPSPAIMPQKRLADLPKTFASLDAQDLPIVREYSAGGLVFDSLGRVAIIARHSRSGHMEWCLPKGHIEKGETPQQTAVREIQEETGIFGEIVDSIATIDYWFTGTSQRVHKLVHHFALRYVSGELTVLGDPDHEAEDAMWVNFTELNDVLSYPNERKIAWLYARKANRRSQQ